MTKKRYLTKSRFKLATECPTKLFYTDKCEYANQNQEDGVLLALADSGFQVGELAKYYFPGGIEVNTLDIDEALAQTKELLQRNPVTIYEAAIATDKQLIRADVLVRNDDCLSLFEVKAKSFDSQEENPFTIRKGTIKPAWIPYLYDVAFQKYVINQALPQYEVSAHLMLADKSVTCPTDGLNQKFLPVKDCTGRGYVKVLAAPTEADLTPPVLCKVNVDAECEQIYAGTDSKSAQTLSFSQRIHQYSDHYVSDTKIPAPISTTCASCEFHTTDEDEELGSKSGMKECWKAQLGWKDEDFECPTVLDVWNFRKKSKLIEAGRIKMSEILEKDVGPEPNDQPGLSTSERQWLQIEKFQNGDHSIWLDRENLQSEMDRWVLPLHFIDFETASVAIPLNAGRRPYEEIAFQFSHHIVREDGSVAHFGEYLNTERGEFPNYEFVRALKVQLEGDSGSIFRYAAHENSILKIIYNQLQADQGEIADREELCEFIKSITHHNPQGSDERWTGERNMVDMLKIVQRYYYDPATNGSNSIKQVLPAMLKSSTFLQDKYSKPIYGSPDGIRSLNFKDWQWIVNEDEKDIDPYKTLPEMFQGDSGKEEEILSTDKQLGDGVAATSAYIRMQFDAMSDYERDEIQKALRRYCELDTMAMVMIYEGWKDIVQQN